MPPFEALRAARSLQGRRAIVTGAVLPVDGGLMARNA